MFVFFSFSPPAISILLNSLISSGYACFSFPLQLLWPNEQAIVEQQGYNLCCLSPSFSLGRLHAGPCWTPKGNTSSPEAATSKAGESWLSFPASILVSFLLLPLTLIQAAILDQGQAPWPKTCPAAGGQEGSAPAFGCRISQPPHLSRPHFCLS